MEDLAVAASAIAGEKTVSRARDLFRDHYLRISSEGAEQLSELVGCGEVADAKGSTNWDHNFGRIWSVTNFDRTGGRGHVTLPSCQCLPKKRELRAHCAHGQGSALGVCKKQGVFYPSGFLLVNYLAINFRVIYLVT